VSSSLQFLVAVVRRFRGSDKGAAAVEAALVFSAFVLLIFGTIEFAQIFWTWNTMMLAVEEGGRYTMVSWQNVNFSGSCTAVSLPPSCTAVLPSSRNKNVAYCAVNQANQTLSSYPTSNTVTVSVSLCTAANPPDPPTMTIQGTFTYNFIPSSLLPYGPITVTSQTTVPLI
jgi:Flp pilus assembly protein TadG